ncbi:MarC family protein [Ponticaulis sp.]|uniref:MarC family protein n=1 Tax=Ponticaulis sp. TaxID=2020902 RepID=UPI000B6520FC|nr:MarC family protein [Ponticaulis sp.]MAI90537.1 MarC family transcriptional regulator [Ponticaulis sp.]OUY00228.1 MAG: MarC family transcriptional regulator [Hyphomonadaceae bacterium TMED5]|tara:strand:+ start:165181 stop:165828 length:648 start_codon:yes stop_codon:yes gene_type:complete
MSTDLISLFSASFVTFFVLIDALGVAPVFASMTAPGGPAYARRMAIKSVIVATIIVFGFAMGGSWLLDKMHISIDAFRAAGGALLFLIAIDMVFEKRTERRENRAESHMSEHHIPEEDISVFPLGIPMLAGPGTIATAMLYMGNSDGDLVYQAVVLAAIGLNMVLVLVAFLLAGPLIRFMGDSVSGALTRILGVILAALSIQLLIDGIKGAFNLG